ncbi:MAG: hypothetical protein H0X17_23050, partial [Deltaproteobacteria bacterium]|nr:hypothetical protein [Deltaproteobacteria bacterium]
MRLRGVARGVATRKQPLLTGLAVFAVAALAFRWARAAAGFWGMDDAAITYAAAFELVDHGSLAPYVEGMPVESYSNPLVFFVVVGLRLLGLFDPSATHLHLEAAVFGVMVLLVWSLLRAPAGEVGALVGAGMFVAIELLTPATWVWYGSGLENVWVSAGLVTLLWICARTARGVPLAAGWGAVMFLVAITRPEAPVYVAGCYVALLGFGRPPELAIRAHVRQLARALVVTVLLYVAFLVWRRAGYGDWWPNTYYAKLHGDARLADNLRDYVVGAMMPYSCAGLFATSALVLRLTRGSEALARCLLVLLAAALAMPITAGVDWMGHHRFATPFFAMAHVSYAALVAVWLARVLGPSAATPRSRRRLHALGLLAVLGVSALLVRERTALWRPIRLNGVTIGLVALQQGGERWEHQMRLGLPFAVVLMPDAGGSLLVGGMQLVDNGYLTDFHQARIGPAARDPNGFRVVNQYQHEERHPDLADPHIPGSVDPQYVAARYLLGEGHLYARRDLVQVATIDPEASLLIDDGPLQIYLSPETVRIAGPGALVRCELIVAWTAVPDPRVRIRGSVEGDHDEITLRPYAPGLHGIERRALLLGAPAHPGAFTVTIELVDGERVRAISRDLVITVTEDPDTLERAAGSLVARTTPLQGARRIAWLREQHVPRLAMTRFRRVMQELERHEQRSREAGAGVLQLRHNARLASLEPLPPAIRTAEVT